MAGLTTKKSTAPLAPGLAAPQVFDLLRERIISLELEPGTVLHRLALQDEFQLSSTPIRDALMRLAEEGLVEIKPQSTTRVSLIDVELARQAMFLRRAVEQEAVRLMAEMPDRGFVKELRAMIEDQAAMAVRAEIDPFYVSDRAFHQRLYEIGGAPDLWVLVRQRSGHIDRIRRLNLPAAGTLQLVVHEHRLIVDAIEAGSPRDAKAALREHLSRAISLTVSLKDRHPHYFQA